MELTTDEMRESLKKKQAVVREKVTQAREDFRSARARKNYYEFQLHQIEEALNLIEQGQLALEDTE